MKTGSKSPLMLLKLMYITLLPGLELQQLIVQPEVTGYLGREVTLPCQLIPGPGHDNVTQVQWEFQPPDGGKIIVIVFNSDHGVSTHDSFLKTRVMIDKQSLVIRDVEKRDEGLYTCNIAAYPSGSFSKATQFVVQEQVPPSSGIVSAVVIAVLLLLVIMAAIAYLICVRRSNSLVRHRVYIDTGGPVRDVGRPSVIKRDEDVVYSAVMLKPSRDVTPSSKDNYTKVTHADDVTYSEVMVI